MGIQTKEVYGVADSYRIPDGIKKNPDPYTNHAWNYAYAGGRWVVFDTTWDVVYVNP